MAEHDVGLLLASTLAAALKRASAELSQALGGPVTAQIEPAKRLFGNDLQGVCDGAGLVVSGPLGGCVEGAVAFVMSRDHALVLAREAEQAEAQPPDGETASLTEADVAAVAFALARIGAAASAVWKEDLGHEVRWPSEPTELTARPFGPGEGGAALAEAAGDDDLGLWTARLGEPVGIELRVSLAAGVAQALAALLEPEAEWAAPVADDRPCSGLARLLPVELPVRVVVARRTLAIRELLQLVPGRVLDLEKRCGEALELCAGAKLVARGEAMVVDERLGFRIVQLVPDGNPQRTSKLVR